MEGWGWGGGGMLLCSTNVQYIIGKIQYLRFGHGTICLFFSCLSFDVNYCDLCKNTIIISDIFHWIRLWRELNRCREVERTFCIHVVTLQSHTQINWVFDAVIFCKFSASVAEKDSGSMENFPNPGSYLAIIFRLKILKFFVNSVLRLRIGDPGPFWPGIRNGKIRIRHPIQRHRFFPL